MLTFPWPVRRRMLLLLSLPPILASCAPLTPTPATSVAAASAEADAGCTAFQRLTFDRLNDTLPTIAGIKAYDAARDAICGMGK